MLIVARGWMTNNNIMFVYRFYLSRPLKTSSAKLPCMWTELIPI